MSLATTFPCEICGKELRHMGTHLTRTHKITRAEYVARFPGAPMASEEFRRGASMVMDDRGMSAYWTAERIVAALQRWAKDHDRPPRYNEWARVRGRTANSRRAQRPSASLVERVFGSWNAGLEAAGLDVTARYGRTGWRAKRCKNGHRRTADNLTTWGACRICARITARDGQRRYRARKKAAAELLARAES